MRQTILKRCFSTSEHFIQMENQFGCHNYAPIKVVASRGEGIHIYDVENKPYMDFISAYSAVNQGHCPPRIVQAMINQAPKLTLTSRAIYNDQLGITEKYLCEQFGFDKVLLMNTGKLSYNFNNPLNIQRGI